MEWRKPSDLKYTDLCIFIDQNIPNILTPGENPELENKIYNYLWLLVKALAIKKNMFQNFEDYDGYAFYAATRLFFALRKNQWNQGKTIKGKLIRPVKSCLNYTKALLNPMRIEYQRETYREIIDEQFTSKKFDSFSFKESLRNFARSYQMDDQMIPHYIADTIKDIDSILENVLSKMPFNSSSPEYKKIKISILLNSVYSLKTKHKLTTEAGSLILWKLPKSMSNYIKVLQREFYSDLAEEIISIYQTTATDDAALDQILAYKEGADYEYEED